jgi:PAS domain S-box-containing protein
MDEPGVETILIVDDEALIALDEKRQLEKEGYRAICAFSGEEAISAVAGEPGKFDLVLMDIDLGRGMDGIETTRRLLELGDIPVLFLSSHTEREYAARADHVGAYGYLVKNSGMVVIAASIRMALRLFEAKRLLKDRETELADNEARLRFALEGSNDGVWDVWMKTGQVYLSPRDCEILGYGVLDAAKSVQVWSQLVHPEDMPRTLERLNAHLEGREPLFKVDQRLRMKSGRYIWVRTRGKVVMRDERGEALRMTGTHSDLSEASLASSQLDGQVGQRLAELEKAERKYRDLIDTTDTGFVIIDDKGVVADANRNYAAFAGREEAEEVVGRSVLEWTAPGDLERNSEAIRSCMEKGFVRNLVIDYLSPAGKTTTVEINATVLAGTQPPRVMGLCRDVTEQVQLERMLRDSEEKFKKVFDDAPIWFCITDLATGEFLDVNEAALRLSGFARDDAVGHSAVEVGLMTPETRNRLVGELKAKGRISGLELELRRKDGSAMVGLFGGEIIAVAGQSRILMTMLDITERKRAEEKTIASLHEKELILMEIHHRVKNNLSVIASLLSLQANAQGGEAARGVLMEAEGRIRSMMVLYDKLYRSDLSGYLPIKGYLLALIEEIAGIFPGSEAILIETRIEDTAISSKTASTLGIIINELITNSMKYAFAGRGAGRLDISVSKAGSRFVLAFRDDGRGLPDSVSFESSSGFGLQLVAMLVNQLGGQARIERGGGAAFVIEFYDLFAKGPGPESPA